MKKATLKPDSTIRIRSEIAHLTGFLSITTDDCEKEFQALESQMENGESLCVEISIHGRSFGFIHADESDFDIEETED